MSHRETVIYDWGTGVAKFIHQRGRAHRVQLIAHERPNSHREPMVELDVVTFTKVYQAVQKARQIQMELP